MVEINPVSVAEASKAANASTKLTDNFETFLTLLTTQLQNQDPLEPMDPSEFTDQLVQFTEVEQSIATNKKLEQLVSLATQNELSGAVSFIGKQVEAKDNRSILKDGQANWKYELDESAEDVSLRVLDSSNVAVFKTNGEKDIGLHKFQWDGKNKEGKELPNGIYTLLVTAVDKKGNTVNSSTNMISTVDGVFTKDGANMLDVGGISIPLDQVISVNKKE
ncbi:MAG: hypothetical protein CMM49_07235 [Rhodospirillaceae bacterium]|nr:hypothetical protein [Rhodospirillaceae bacterium]|tara:strand:- start:9047 stop:9706 length:660 start_codon:yes stop_codon:yes gene_type:complete